VSSDKLQQNTLLLSLHEKNVAVYRSYKLNVMSILFIERHIFIYISSQKCNRNAITDHKCVRNYGSI